MQICTIIAEYNPYHAGHARQIAEIRRLLPGCAVVSVMSGCYAQRGEPALWEPYTRAKCAVQAGGPDLVLELPIAAALSSAEGFALGGVRLIRALGCATHLSFGCETGTNDSLLRLAESMESDAFADALRAHLAEGVSYAQAASRAAAALCPQEAHLLDSPNDALAVQYLRAALRELPGLQPLAIRRVGAQHDGAPEGGIPSASYIRDLFRDGEPERALALLPAACRETAQTARRHSWRELEPAVLPYLRRLSPEELRALPGVSEGLEHRFRRACREAASLDELWERTRSRRYPLSRVRRLTLCAYLGLTRELAALPPAYIRVLAMNARGAQALRRMKTTCSLPVIVRPTQARALTGDAKTLWDFSLRADDLYNFPAPAGEDWRRTPYAAQ